MFLTSLAVFAVAISFFQMGALSVWVSVLSLSLKVVLLAAFAAAVLYLWRRLKS
jgi:hypothetical protein